MNEETKRSTLRKLPLKASLAAVALLGVGVAAGATAIRASGPVAEMAPAKPVAIAGLSDSENVVTVKGRVAEVYGPMFVLQDGSGRALIDAGRRHGMFGMGGNSFVAADTTVTIQGRFHDGIIRASFLVAADGTVTALGGPPHDHRGPGDRGPGRGVPTVRVVPRGVTARRRHRPPMALRRHRRQMARHRLLRLPMR